LLGKITALRQRLQQAQGLAQEAGSAAAALARGPGPTVRTLERFVDAGAAHDAKHTLVKWLAKCPVPLNNSLKGSAEWSLVVAMWDNGIRYLSFDGLLGYLRSKGAARRIKGGPESIVRYNVTRLVDAAEVVHKKGLAQWVSSTRK